MLAEENAQLISVRRQHCADRALGQKRGTSCNTRHSRSLPLGHPHERPPHHSGRWWRGGVTETCMFYVRDTVQRHPESRDLAVPRVAASHAWITSPRHRECSTIPSRRSSNVHNTFTAVGQVSASHFKPTNRRDVILSTLFSHAGMALGHRRRPNWVKLSVVSTQTRHFVLKDDADSLVSFVLVVQDQ